jgi:predicted Rossmann-fold nucleotide-binding protein
MLEWLKDVVLKEGNISKEDLDIFTVVDTPRDAVAAIKRFYAR